MNQINNSKFLKAGGIELRNSIDKELNVKSINYGLIFRSESNEIFLGKYENNTIREFFVISDDENIYADLPLEKFAFVDVIIKEKSKEEYEIDIRDICTLSFNENENEKSKTIEDVLREENFPSQESDDLFSDILILALDEEEENGE